MIRRVLTLCTLVTLTGMVLPGQTTYTSRQGAPVQKYRSVDLRDQGPSTGFIEYLSYPKPGGEGYHTFLAEQKARASALFPETKSKPQGTRSSIDGPEVIRGFLGNSWTAGIPLDNHLAVNRQDQIVTVVNTQLVVIGPTGIYQETYSLDDFWSPTGEDFFYFDPRVIYDPEEDRFIMAMVQDFDCAGSNIAFAFSASNDPAGVWHLYLFDGCPGMDSTFADFPMISLTENDLFFTYNAVHQDSTWQTGFTETFIYQISKRDGYAGDELTWRSWQDITHDGIRLRYICPVKHATAILSDDAYFLSNRSFDIANDTVFLVSVDGAFNEPDAQLTVTPMRSDVQYGVPPNARQPMDFLQTNDARVLDAFYMEGHIQFVGNTMEQLSGRSAVYHGIVSDVDGDPILNGRVLGHGFDHLAYPGIAFTGPGPFDREAIITACHTSENRYPGYSALFFDGGDYSEWVTVKEGLRNIDMIKVDNPFGIDPTNERWGDYSGIQRQFAEEGTIYVSASYGKPGNVNETWISYLSRPGMVSATEATSQEKGELRAFPNPAATFVTFDVDVNAPGALLEAHLFDSHGRSLGLVFSERIVHRGPCRFHYNSAHLPAGTYVVQVSLEGKVWRSEKIVVR